MSGATSYEPFLHVERADLARLTRDEATYKRELREARRLVHGGRRADPRCGSREGTRLCDRLMRCVKNLPAAARKKRSDFRFRGTRRECVKKKRF
jgi:hypothetical protein